MNRLFLLFILFIPVSNIAQLDLPEYGINKYGNTLEQSFHTAVNVSQDSLGRITAYSSLDRNAYSIFDGVEFSYGRMLEGNHTIILNDSAGIWSVKDAFTLVLHTKGDTFNLNVREYLDRNISFIEKYQNFYFLFTNDGLIKLKLDKFGLKVVSAHNYKTERIYMSFLSNDTIYCKTEDDHGYLLWGNLDKMHYYDKKQPDCESIMILPDDRIVPIGFEPHKESLFEIGSKIIKPYVDSKGNLWMYLRGNTPGIYKSYDGQLIKQDFGINEGTYCEFYEDNLGDMWIGTYGDGLVHLYDKALHVIGLDNNLKSNNIWSINQKKDGAILFSQGCSGINEISTSKNIRVSKGCHGVIYNDSKGRTWASTFGLELYENGKKTYLTKKDGLYSRTILSIFEDSDAQMWFGTRRVLHKYVNGRFEQYIIEDTDTYDRIYNILEIGNKRLLLALDNGSFYIFENEKFTKLSFQLKSSSHLLKDLEGNIWLASEGDGLFLYNNETFGPIRNQSIPSSITFIQDSPEGHLWGVCSGNRIFYLKKEEILSNSNNATVKFITSGDGLPLININSRLQPSTELLANGNIIFPNIHGAIHINPEKYIKARSDYRSQIYIDDKVIHQQSQIDIKSNKFYVDLKVKGIYLNPEAKILNEYKLDDNNWNSIKNGKSKRIDLPNYGVNNLQVRTKHINDEWEYLPAINLNVQKPFYLTLWFNLFMALFVVSLIYFISKSRIKHISRQNKILEKKVKNQTQQIESEKKQLSETLERQKQLTLELNIAYATKNRMYAQVSHEFKSPLQAIQSFLNSKNQKLETKDKERISRNVKSLLHTSEEIMELSKAESGNLKLKPNYYNINGLIKEQIELKSFTAAENNIEITFANSDEIEYIKCDIQQMQKVISNLLSNAIKFSDHSSAITVESIIKGEDQIIKIQDYGQGIPELELKNLTQPYFQASNNSKQGTGIGLSLSAEILKLHGSLLEVKSDLGKGSTFSFKLKRPIKSQHAIRKIYTDSLSIDQQLKEHIQQGKETILVVDDNPDILLFLKNTLQKDYNIFTANQGEEGLLIAKNYPINLIISDVNMPLMSGFELLSRIKKLEKLETIPFIFLTGSQSEETELLSLKAGVDLIIRKPIREEYLVPQVTQLLKRQIKIIDLANKAIAHNLLPPDIRDDDKELMKKVELAMLDNINNSRLKSEDIAKLVGLGEKTLRNKVKQISGYTLKEYLKLYRLNKAKILLEQNYGTKSEIAAATGFSSLSYFSKNYNSWLTTKKEEN